MSVGNVACVKISKLTAGYLCNICTPKISSYDLGDATQKFSQLNQEMTIWSTSWVTVMFFYNTGLPTKQQAVIFLDQLTSQVIQAYDTIPVLRNTLFTRDCLGTKQFCFRGYRFECVMTKFDLHCCSGVFVIVCQLVSLLLILLWENWNTFTWLNIRKASDIHNNHIPAFSSHL